jgi:nucleoside-diphosphate-sugar epimerase
MYVRWKGSYPLSMRGYRERNWMGQGIALVGSNGFIGNAIRQGGGYSRYTCYSHAPGPHEIYFDLNNKESWQELIHKGHSKAIILAWPGLDSYSDLAHITKNLPNTIELITGLISSGLQDLVVAGTCYEYGTQSGCLHPDAPTTPVTMYGVAKDSLNRSLAILSKESGLRFCWARIFYPYGTNQRETSLLPSLIRASKSANKAIQLGNPELIRDFSTVEHIASQLIKLVESNTLSGNFNCGSGIPITLKGFVEMCIVKYNLEVNPIYGKVATRPWEPQCCWADLSNWEESLWDSKVGMMEEVSHTHDERSSF